MTYRTSHLFNILISVLLVLSFIAGSTVFSAGKDDSERDIVKAEQTEETADDTKEPVREPFDTDTGPVHELIDYLESGAPLRWDDVWWTMQLKYPYLAYYYYDIDSGTEVMYNGEDVIYAASLIKVPVIYSVIRELEKDETPDGEEEDEKEKDAVSRLDEKWYYDPLTMYMEGSGSIAYMPCGTELTVRELFEYALLVSDNVAFEQIIRMFGTDAYHEMLDRLGIEYGYRDFMDLSPRELGLILYDLYGYFEEGSPYAMWMKKVMEDSLYRFIIPQHYPGVDVPHKYGWDTDAFHQMAIVFDTHPFVLVIMTDYEDGDGDPGALEFYNNVIELTKKMHADFYGEEYAPSLRDDLATSDKTEDMDENGKTEDKEDMLSSWAEWEYTLAIAAGIIPDGMKGEYGTPAARKDVVSLFLNVIEKAYGKDAQDILEDIGASTDGYSFSDTESDDVRTMAALGIVNGTGKGRFTPDGIMTRAEAAAVICRIGKLFGIDTSGYENPFNDVTGKYSWTGKELGWPSYTGIINGTGKGRFSPGKKLTAETAVVLAYRTYTVLAGIMAEDGRE